MRPGRPHHVEQSASGTARATTGITVVLNTEPRLGYLTTNRHPGPDGDASALQAALSGYAMDADSEAFRRDPGGHLEHHPAVRDTRSDTDRE